MDYKQRGVFLEGKKRPLAFIARNEERVRDIFLLKKRKDAKLKHYNTQISQKLQSTCDID